MGVSTVTELKYLDSGLLGENIPHGGFAGVDPQLRGALTQAGFDIRHSEAGLYVWASQEMDCWESVSRLATQGILVTPGAFYGDKGQKFVRVALTATDDAVNNAVARLTNFA